VVQKVLLLQQAAAAVLQRQQRDVLGLPGVQPSWQSNKASRMLWSHQGCSMHVIHVAQLSCSTQWRQRPVCCLWAPL